MIYMSKETNNPSYRSIYIMNENTVPNITAYVLRRDIYIHDSIGRKFYFCKIYTNNFKRLFKIMLYILYIEYIL